MPGISAVPDDVNARYFHVVVAGPEVFSCNHTFFSFLYHLMAAGPVVQRYLHAIIQFFCGGRFRRTVCRMPTCLHFNVLVDVCQLTSLFIEMASLVWGYFHLLQKGFWSFLKLQCYEQNDPGSVLNWLVQFIFHNDKSNCWTFYVFLPNTSI